MNELFYRSLLYALLPAGLLRLWMRSLRLPAYRRRLLERFGRVNLREPKPGRQRIWLHAVSVGEINAARPLVDALLASERYDLVISNTTPTGASRTKQLFGDTVQQVMMPYDLPRCVRRFLQACQPDRVIIMETEIWPVMLRLVQESGIRCDLVNGRLSDRSVRGYRWFQPLLRQALERFTEIHAQSRRDADRFRALGAPQQAVHISGNLKFDLDTGPLPSDDPEIDAALKGHGPVLMAASTHAGEEDAVLKAFQGFRQRHPSALLLLAPRHPERSVDIVHLLQQYGFDYGRRSLSELPEPDHAVLLIDTLGELTRFLPFAEACFVGGSLTPVGGHNLLEPAAYGLAIQTGPHMGNFRDITQILSEAGALKFVNNTDSLMAAWLDLWENPERREAMGQHASQVLNEHAGVTRRLIEALRLA